MKAADALDAAKRLHGVIGRLAERRERQVQKATGEFQLDLLAAIKDQPDEILEMIMRAVMLDPGQAYLQLALSMAVDERNDRRAHLRFDRRTDTERSRASEAETESPPAPEAFGGFEIEGDPGILADLVPPALSGPVPSFASLASPMDGDDVDEGGRYPEPGEPATVLPDGRVVALEPGTLDAPA